MASDSHETSPADDRRNDGRGESANERADRNWDELMQETRVMQTGTQILSGFLLAVVFQQRFTDIDNVQLALYVVLVVLAACASILALVPVRMHRKYFARGRKAELVATTSKLVAANLVVVGALSVGVTTLILDVALGRTAGIVTLVIGAIVVVALWLVRPSPVASPAGE
ncbi:DUF6328 family protein [Microbacterium marmarense]|uniref:DUF6328 family protein n=1 Tax=Microbacterium marmarense TaxID=3122051 RepID=A0ABU8LRQ4_9MICO